MQSAAHLADDATQQSSWYISRNGDSVAVVAARRENGEVLVAAELAGEGSSGRSCPNRFTSASAAEAFIGDLIASFSYLGCEVARGEPSGSRNTPKRG
jgi:hypothetical protein